MISQNTSNIIATLQTDILRLQGFKTIGNAVIDLGLDPIKDAFPNASFPLGAIHEFLTATPEEGAATGGFIAGLLSALMANNGIVLWISSSRMLFPPALKNFGIQPDRFIFIDLQNEKDVMWAMDEALKCGALSAVVGEVNELSFTASRRLQLSVEASQVTGFILRNNARKVSTTTCVSRWKITPLPSEHIDEDMPGLGFPQWKVELLRIRNGKPGVWNLRWINGKFEFADYNQPAARSQQPASERRVG
jgi:protein ImuA